jgi:hypothetical protein
MDSGIHVWPNTYSYPYSDTYSYSDTDTDAYTNSNTYANPDTYPNSDTTYTNTCSDADTAGSMRQLPDTATSARLPSLRCRDRIHSR